MTRELINFKGTVPLKMLELNPPDISKTWRDELCVILVVWGNAEVIVGGERSTLADEDVIVINPNTVFEVRSKNCCAVQLLIDVESLPEQARGLSFDCDSSKSADQAAFYTVKHLTAVLLKENGDAPERNTFLNLAVIYSLLSELTRNFVSKEKAEPVSDKHMLRLRSIIEYMNAHYREGVTLKALASHVHLTVPYLSAFFETTFGVNFTDYYGGLRLERAVDELTSTETPIDTIARNNGFSNSRAFVAMFKKRYDVLPSVYRKDMARLAIRRDDTFESGLYGLAKYLTPQNAGQMPDRVPVGNAKSLSLGKISLLRSEAELRHTFRVFTSVGRAKELLYADVQKMLTELQNEIGFEYIKFHGILSDDMLLYDENALGEPRYSFVLLDKAIDFLLSIGLKPLIQFSFTPKKLASDKDAALFSSELNVSLPNDLEKWENLVRVVTEHFMSRYGRNVVRHWLFCVWNEPNLPLWSPFTDAEFCNLYNVTRNAVKRVYKGLSFGMPSVAYTAQMGEWAQKFFGYCRENNCMPDFCNIHYYDNDLTGFDAMNMRPADVKNNDWLGLSVKLNSDENAFPKAIADMRGIFADAGASDISVYMTEWNLTISHRNLLNDTCFKACYLAKNILENYDDLDSFGYWVLTDFIEETQPSNEHFHGGLGLFTHSGIKKANYYAFTLLNKLGDRLLGRGNGWFITKSYGKIQIMLYNYEHFSHLFASGETFDMSFTKRYTPFSKLDKMNVKLTLTDLPVKDCYIREHILNWKHGSAFDAWVEMGARIIDDGDVEYLKRVSVPKVQTRKAQTTDGELEISAELEPLEVRLIEVTLSRSL